MAELTAHHHRLQLGDKKHRKRPSRSTSPSNRSQRGTVSSPQKPKHTSIATRNTSAGFTTAPVTRRRARDQGRFLRSGKARSNPSNNAPSKRMPPPPRIWSRASDVQDLVYLLLDEYNEGGFVDGKPADQQLWERVASNLAIPNLTGTQVKTKVNALKADYKAFNILKEQTGVSWNQEAYTVDADDDWWARMVQAHPNTSKFKAKGLSNYAELDLLFANTSASEVLRHSSSQKVATAEEGAQLDCSARYIHMGIHNVNEERITSRDAGNLNRAGTASMETGSGSRKRGPPSVMSAAPQRRTRITQATAADKFIDAFREYMSHHCWASKSPDADSDNEFIVAILIPAYILAKRKRRKQDP